MSKTSQPKAFAIRDMSATIETINGWSQTWTDLVVAIVWQSTLLALIVAVVAFGLRRSSPGLRFWLWQIVTIKLLLMPFWTMAIPFPMFPRHESAAATGSSAMQAGKIERPPAVDLPASGLSETAPSHSFSWSAHLRDFTWRSWLLLLWCAVVTVQVLRLAWQRVRLTRLLQRTNTADDRVEQLVAKASEKLGLNRSVRAVVTDLDCSPFVCGMWRPVLVLPHGLMRSLDQADLLRVLLHELAHVKRRDLVWSWIPEVTRILYFFHPVVYCVNSRIRLERELSCDQWAMSTAGVSAADYADTLMKVVRHSSQSAALKAATASSLRMGSETSSTPVGKKETTR